MSLGPVIEKEPGLDSRTYRFLSPSTKRLHFRAALIFTAAYLLSACGQKSGESSPRYPVFLGPAEKLSLTTRTGKESGTLFAELAYAEEVVHLRIDAAQIVGHDGYKTLKPSSGLSALAELGVITNPTLVALEADLDQLALFAKPDFSQIAPVDPGVDRVSLWAFPVVVLGRQPANPALRLTTELNFPPLGQENFSIGYAVAALNGWQLKVLGYTNP